MKQSKYILFLILLLFIITRCSFIEEIRPEVSNQLNRGFLAYHSGLLVTEGVKIVPYTTPNNNNSTDTAGYILLGSTDTGNDKNYFIVKTDVNGNIIWQKSHGSYSLDNHPVDIFYDEFLGLINVLGYEFDESINRLIPSLTTFDLMGEEVPLNIDFKSKINRNIVFEEKSTSLIVYKNIGLGYRVVSTIGENIDSINTANYYVVDFANNIIASNRFSFSFSMIPNDKYSVTSTFVRKSGNNSFYLISSHRNAAYTVYNSFLKFEIDIVNDTAIQTGAWTYQSSNNTIMMDCEIIEGNGSDIIILTKNNEDNLMSNTIELPPLSSNWMPGNVDLIPSSNLKTTTHGKIAPDSKATISKVDDKEYFITASRVSDHALMIMKIPDISNENVLDWATDWNGSYEFNNISESTRFKHVRNNIANVIKSHKTGEYCVMGTHDFLDVTKMIMMQLDANGKYIRSPE